MSYETWIHENDQGAIRCWSRRVSTGIIGLGKNGYYEIESEQVKNSSSYHARWLQYFNLTCPGRGEIMDDMTTDLERPASLTFAGEEEDFCVDYVDVFSESSRTSCLLCGNQTMNSRNCEKEFYGSILVTFRTSNLQSDFTGFKMNVKCSEPSEQNLPGCIQSLPAEKEKATTDNEDSHSYYIAVRKGTSTITTANDIIIFALRPRSFCLQMPRNS